MVRIGFTAVAVVLLAGAFPAAADTAQLEREYTNRLISMSDTPAAHVELARWCQAQGLADRAERHWQEAIARDPECAEARAALGYVKRNMHWVQTGEKTPAATAPAAAADPAETPPAPPQDPTFVQRRGALVRQIQEIFSQHLLTSDIAARAEGRQQLLQIRDPAAAEPIARIFSTGDESVRQLACEALGQIPGDEATRLLTRFVLSEDSEEVRRSAISALASRGGGTGLTQLMNALNGSPKALDRAAFALGEIGDLRAAPALIAHLRTPQTKVLQAPAPSQSSNTGSYFFSGTIIPYIANATPVVADRAVGWDLQIGVIPVGTGITIRNSRVTIYRTIIEFVERPAVHDALQKMVGENHDYNAAEWRAAVARRLAEAAKPPQ